MNRFCTIVAAASLGLVIATGAYLEAADGKDDVVGARWNYTIAGGGKPQRGDFRVFKHEIFQKGQKIGIVRPEQPGQSTLVISGAPQLNGSISIRKVRRKPAIWRGTLTRPDGSTSKIKFDVKDR